MTPSSLLLALILCATTFLIGFEAGRVRGEMTALKRCLAMNDGDTSSGMEVRR